MNNVIAIDFETTSLDYLEMGFEGFSFCDGTDAKYYTRLDPLIPLCEDKVVSFHNAPFDLKCCRKFLNWEPEKIFCTLTGAKLVDENRMGYKPYSLKTLARDWLGVKETKEYKEVVGTSDFEEYAINDAKWTYGLYQYEYSRLKKEGLLHLAEIEMEFQKTLADLEINGISVNQKELSVAIPTVKSLWEEAKIDCCKAAGLKHWYDTNLFGQRELKTEINLDSTQQLVKLVEEKLGFVIEERTKKSKTYPKGQKSVGKKTKNDLKNKHPFFPCLIRYHKLSKLWSSFIEPSKNFIDSDGKIRPSYNMVRTGRLSCSSPNLQQLPNPKKEKLAYNYRKIFVPGVGTKNQPAKNVLIKSDYSGQELRVLSEVSQDATMVDAFNRNLDLHLLTANRIFSLGLSDEALIDGTKAHSVAAETYKRERHQAKNGVNFPTVYGASPKRIAEDNNVSICEATRWLDEFNRLYPGVQKAIKTTKKMLWDKGYVCTLMGRKRRFPRYRRSGRWDRAKMERQAFNFKIQGFSADMIKCAANLIRPKLPFFRAKIVLTVHDELVYECPEVLSKPCAKMIKDCMENCVCLSVPIIADVTITKCYGD